MGLKYYSNKEVKNYNIKLDELTYKAKVYPNTKFNNFYILVEPNKIIKISETNNNIRDTCR